MILAIDAGNTNVCLALFQEQTLLKGWRVLPGLFKDKGKAVSWIEKELAALGVLPGKVEASVISCVVPDLLQSLKESCTYLFSKEPLVLGTSSAPFPHSALIDNPEEVGTDLMVNAFAAHKLYRGPLLVVDFGTATTLSLIDGQGNFCGTVLAPGLQLSFQVLYESAAQLYQVPLEKPGKVLGTNTKEAMQSGIFWGYVSMIEGLIQRIKEENFKGMISKDFKVIATGGLSSLIVPSCPSIKERDVDLTLKGIALLYDSMLKGERPYV